MDRDLRTYMTASGERVEREVEVKIKCEKCGREIVAVVPGLCNHCHRKQ